MSNKNLQGLKDTIYEEVNKDINNIPRYFVHDDKEFILVEYKTLGYRKFKATYEIATIDGKCYHVSVDINV